jgi:hypothetical protein
LISTHETAGARVAEAETPKNTLKAQGKARRWGEDGKLPYSSPDDNLTKPSPRMICTCVLK